MKKVFISLIMSGFLFTACSSDETLETPEEKAVGAIEATISFDQTNTKADPALSKAIPLTSWKNIESVQMFLYETGTGKIVYASDYLDPYNAGGTPITKFTWTNIPVGTGTYDLALVANAKSSVATHVSTYIGTTAVQWGQYNVKEDKLLNTDVFAKLKPGTLPAVHTSQSAAHAAQKGYIVPSEVFTAYATGIQIEEGVTKTLATALKLKREVSLLRVRINREAIPTTVKFDDDKASVLIQRQPQKLGFKQGTFAGGIVAGTANDVNELIVGGTGATAFNAVNPAAADYSNNTQMLTAGFTLWKDIVVFPNLPSAEVVSVDAPVASNRRYIIRVSALAPKDYVLDNNTVLSAPTTVWWYGYIPHAFTANTIREINLTLTSKGKITIPAVPDPEGGLIINLTAPEDWNANIDRSDLEL